MPGCPNWCAYTTHAKTDYLIWYAVKPYEWINLGGWKK